MNWKVLLLLVSLLLSGTILTQAQANFYQGDWPSLLNASEKREKIFFVDFYADWCVPCKKMDTLVFSDKNVWEYINKHFIAYRMNIETNERGKELAFIHGIDNYPTVIFFNAKEEEVGRIIGFTNKSKFLQEMRKFGPQMANMKYTKFR